MRGAIVNAPAHQALRGPRFAVRLALGFILVVTSSAAIAEVGATASIFSESRLRGYSLSAGHPVGQLDLSYDDPTGFYGSLSGTLVLSAEYGVKPLGLQESIGYAKRLGRGPTIDVGLINANYSHYTGYERSTGYTEIYAGLVGKVVSSHIYLSPNYFHSGRWVAYGELDAGIRPARKLRLSAHVGTLIPLDSSYASRLQYDWQIGATRELGALSLHVTLSAGGPGRDFYEDVSHRRRAFVVGATYVF